MARLVPDQENYDGASSELQDDGNGGHLKEGAEVEEQRAQGDESSGQEVRADRDAVTSDLWRERERER